MNLLEGMLTLYGYIRMKCGSIWIEGKMNGEGKMNSQERSKREQATLNRDPTNLPSLLINLSSGG